MKNSVIVALLCSGIMVGASGTPKYRHPGVICAPVPYELINPEMHSLQGAGLLSMLIAAAIAQPAPAQAPMSPAPLATSILGYRAFPSPLATAAR